MNDFITIPAIVTLVYLAAYFLKLIPGEVINKLIPAICGTLGLILGVVCYYTLPGFIPAENWITAAAIGIVSGFAATGVNQVYKQITKNHGETAEPDTNEDIGDDERAE